MTQGLASGQGYSAGFLISVVHFSDQEVEGVVVAEFEPLGEAFGKVLAASHGHGGALHVRVDGKVVADLWGGNATAERSWQSDTPSVIFSCTKGLISILAGELVREGRLDLDAPVSAYWPEFDRHGKGAMPVRWLFTHRAGLPAVRDDLELADVVNWDRMVEVLAQEEPLLPPGETHQYHALTFGWLVGEIIRRISGMGVDEFFAERIVQPLGIEAWIGTPEHELPRVAQLYATAPPPEPLPLPSTVDPELASLNERAMTFGSAFSDDLAQEDAGFNSDDVRRAVIPGAGGIATAAALATIWSATVCNAEKTRLLNDEVIADMSREQAAGEPAVPLPGPWARWGTGFMLSSEVRPFLTNASFGHDGAGGQVAFADPENKVGFAYLTNDIQRSGDQRGVLLVEVLRDLLGVRE
jgi:CubicO group peptidase (beta-lactamase class C family)